MGKVDKDKLFGEGRNELEKCLVKELEEAFREKDVSAWVFAVIDDDGETSIHVAGAKEHLRDLTLAVRKGLDSLFEDEPRGNPSLN